MASHVVVVDATARRATVKTIPGTYLSDVRDEACKKFSVKADQYTLKLNNKPLDLSRTIRLANIPPGAKLDLVQSSRSPTVISVALQLPESENNLRLTRKFPSNTSLWQILRIFESDPEQNRNFNFTQRGVPELESGATSGAGRLNYEMPVLNIMNRERSSFVELQQTLGQLGFTSGSALLRLGFRNSGQPLEEAMADISRYFQDAELEIPKAPGAHAETSDQARSMPDATEAAVADDVAGEDNPPEPTPMEDVILSPPSAASSNTPASEVTNDNTALAAASAAEIETAPVPDNTIVGPGHRTLQVFAPPSTTTPTAARQTWDESDYVPTVDHAKLHQSRLQEASRNKRLLSDAEIAEQEKAKSEKLAAVTRTTIRIRLPDQSIVEAAFGRLETAASLYELVRDMLEHANQPFQLRYTGPRGNQIVLKEGPEKLVQDLGFQGRMLVNCVWHDKADAKARREPALKQEWRDKAQTLKVAYPVMTRDVPKAEAAGPATVADKGKGKLSDVDKESKMKAFLKKGLFKK